MVDEFTMLNQNMLYWLDKRLRQGSGKHTEPFGGIVLVLVGDPAQLPPVTGYPLWHSQSKGSHQQQAFTMYISKFTNVIKLVGSNRLDDVPSKQRFQSFLDRLRDGTNTQDDHEWVNSVVQEEHIINRIGLDTFNQQFKSNVSNWFFDTNEELVRHNLLQLQKTGKPITRINAIHNNAKAKAVDPSHMRNLEQVLYLSVNSLVMYTANSSFHYKIVNGSVGVVKDIIYNNDEGPPDALPIAVIVSFDTYTGPSLFCTQCPYTSQMMPIPGTEKWVPVTPIIADCEFSTKENELTRKQIPLKLTWGFTPWKAQGSTFSNPIGIIVGTKEKTEGLTYTKISRATRIENICIPQGISLDRLTLDIAKCKRLKHRIVEERRLDILCNNTTEIYENCIQHKQLCECNCGRDVTNNSVHINGCLFTINI